MRLFNFLGVVAACLALSVLTTQAANARAVVKYQGISKGTIVVKTSERRLYVGLGNGKAVRYPVGVGRSGKQWRGERRIRSKRLKPAWSPTAQILRDSPNIAKVIPGGSPKNPMGAAALVLSGSGQYAGQYAIHGTNKPGSIGRFVSYGCIRMHNKDIKDLFSRVRVGAKVVVKQ